MTPRSTDNRWTSWRVISTMPVIQVWGVDLFLHLSQWTFMRRKRSLRGKGLGKPCMKLPPEAHCWVCATLRISSPPTQQPDRWLQRVFAHLWSLQPLKVLGGKCLQMWGNKYTSVCNCEWLAILITGTFTELCLLSSEWACRGEYTERKWWDECRLRGCFCLGGSWLGVFYGVYGEGLSL